MSGITFIQEVLKENVVDEYTSSVSNSVCSICLWYKSHETKQRGMDLNPFDM
jgi:hypothetical protein